MDILSTIQDAVIGMAESPWVLLALFAFCVIDGFFPPIPSESVVIALAALAVAGDGVPILAIIPVAAAGAMTGDLIAFSIGRRVPVRTMRLFSSGKGKATLAWAERQLARRGGTFILSARYIPVGRVAVNMTAGAVGFPLRRFVAFDALAAITWAVYSTVIGLAAGRFFHDYPLLGVVVGIVGGVLIGTLVDSILSRRSGRTEDKPAEGEAPEGDATEGGAVEGDAAPVPATRSTEPTD
ncbi:conserved protein DedA family [Beutenbergia cavernae DSM 12333]|uniref:Conserved protein DedA family n=1 Tax=Beutenbergia cavernae (strain ATCC BAA-8 / DSM 12333 / CCUG 43141 / JCM 11478 / NBRC 16432 / NCIMB 13614 / HKI 0122) TaxID=471853 RepID=C5C016_BEUC1|nr:DedA family protein [Beutenbergia cavernae]ACQ81346.1 conserved protein DedA family [Beutenbergia cavernae DSM 12333]